MKAEIPPAPAPGRLEELPLHVVVRDYPETLPILRSEGVDLGSRGGRPLSAGDGDSSRVMERILAAVAWRPEGGSEAR